MPGTKCLNNLKIINSKIYLWNFYNAYISIYIYIYGSFVNYSLFAYNKESTMTYDGIQN